MKPQSKNVTQIPFIRQSAGAAPQTVIDMKPVETIGQVDEPETAPPETTIVSRQLSPLVEAAADKIKAGMDRIKADWWNGFIAGAVIVLIGYLWLHKDGE